MRAVLLVLIGAIGVQSSAVLSMSLFGALGVLQTSALRFLLAAALLIVLFRPRIRGKTPKEWASILVFGTSMALASTLLYLAIERIPLGVATTIDFLGPCIVALAASKRIREAFLALAAFAGVALIAGLGGPFDIIGLLYAAGAGACFAFYTVFVAAIGKSAGGVGDVALAVSWGAVLMMPFSIPAIPTVEASQWGILALSAFCGMALAFSVDTLAGKLTSARIVGVLFAFDPVVGTIIGWLWLDQMLSATTVLGILMVILAGAGIVWSAGAQGPPPKRNDTPAPG